MVPGFGNFTIMKWQNGSVEIVGVLPAGYIPTGVFIDPTAVGLVLMLEGWTVFDAGARALSLTVRLAAGQPKVEAEVGSDLTLCDTMVADGRCPRVPGRR